MKPEIVLVLSKANAPGLLPALEERYTVHRLPATGDMAAAAARCGQRARALVTPTLVGADARLIDTLPNLEIIVCPGGHVDRIDRAVTRARGIPVTNTPNVSAPDVADLAIGHLLAVARRVCDGDAFVRAGRWNAGPMGFGIRVGGKRLGIVGLGVIGRIVAKRAAGLDMEVCYHGPRRKADVPYRYYSDLVAMARAVDFMVLNCSAGPATRHLIDRAVLAALGPRGVLVNVARGSAVDHQALLEALADGTIAGAGLDAFENEPHVPARLLGMENVVLTAHTGAFTTEAKAIMVELALANLDAHFAGEPLPSPVP